jgi:predicted acylesterase/phospholipase RssA
MDEELSIGLALSGGGFRATLFHLGVVRFLRDANYLQYVRHISSVSGGTIIGAHLVQNWSRYSSPDDDEFQRAANEILEIVKGDLRGRIVRRLPYNWVIWRWRRIQFLTECYQNFIKTESLKKGGGRPELSILTTNLNTGRPWSFDSVGFTEEPLNYSKHRVATTLPTVAKRMVSSSAFPAFFPSLRLTAKDLGFDTKTFPNPQFFTDGGVYDNLGTRKFMSLLQRHDRSRDERERIDVVILSDAGRGFEWDSKTSASGLFRTVSRSMDIAMNRVGSLDLEAAVRRDPRFLLLNIGHEVPRGKKPSTLTEEVQRQLKSIRTDLDAFSDLEIRCLVLHGFCVARELWPEIAYPIGARFRSLRVESQERLLRSLGVDLRLLTPWDPLLAIGGKQKDQPPPNYATGIFEPIVAVPLLQKSQKLKLRFFDARDWVSYLNLLVCAIVILVAFHFGVQLFRHETPDFLARSYEETIELTAPETTSQTNSRGSMRRTVTASIIKMRDDGVPLERGVATVGDRVEATCFSHAKAEFIELRPNFPGIMKHEYSLKIPLLFTPSLAEQNVVYQFLYVNNLSAGSDWVNFIPPFPIAHYQMVLQFPLLRPCKHLLVTKITEAGVNKSVIFDSAKPPIAASGFDWDAAKGKLIWSATNLTTGPVGYQVDFDW